MTHTGSKVTVLTWLKNEEHILPFFLRHYAFADEIIAWDNGSTDSSRRMLEANPKVSIRDWDSGGELRDDQLLQMKNEEYHHTGPGWKFIVDIDEFIWHENILMLLSMADSMGMTLLQTEGFDMVSMDLPIDDGVTPLTQIVKMGRPNPWYNKLCVVKHCCHIEYMPGAHTPRSLSGKVIVSDQPYLKLLHYRYLSRQFVMEKAKRIVLSEYNRNAQVGITQASPLAMERKWNATWHHRIQVLT